MSYLFLRCFYQLLALSLPIYNTKEKPIQDTKETESAIANSVKDTTLIVVDTIKAVKPE